MYILDNKATVTNENKSTIHFLNETKANHMFNWYHIRSAIKANSGSLYLLPTPVLHRALHNAPCHWQMQRYFTFLSTWACCPFGQWQLLTRQHFPTRVELADDTTALHIYWRMWWHGPLPRPHLFVAFCLRTDSGNRHIFGCENPGVGPMTPKFELGQDFCRVHLTTKSHHPTFNRSEVIVLTNRETNRCRWKHKPRYVGG